MKLFIQIGKFLGRPESFFFCASLIFGLCFTVFTGPFQVPDEFQHFDRAYAVSTGILFGNKGEIPISITQLQTISSPKIARANVKFSIGEVAAFFSIPLKKEVSLWALFPNTAIYSPLPYIPQAAGLLIGRAVNLSPLGMLIVARMFNLLVWIFLCTIAIRTTPSFKWLFVVLILMPMSLFQAASVSADSFLNALGFLTLGVYLRIILDNHIKVGLFEILLLVGLGFLLPFCKSTYGILMALVLAIPLSKFYSRKLFLISTITLFLVVLFSSVMSFQISQEMIITFHPKEGLKPFDQALFLIQHPARFFTVTWKSIRILGDVYLKTYIGLFGWLDTPLPDYIYRSYPIVLIGTAILDHDENFRLSLLQKVVFAATSLAAFLLVFLALYITWTPYRQSSIDGVQGRYFIPIIPPFLLIFTNRWINLQRYILPVMLNIYILLTLIQSLTTLANRFYVL